MAISYVKGSYAIDEAVSLSEVFLANERQRVFVVIGGSGIGKDYALRAMLKSKFISTIEMPIFVSDTVELIVQVEEFLLKHPHKLYYWADQELSSLKEEEMATLLNHIENKIPTFTGKLLITARFHERSEIGSAEVPNGVWIDMDKRAMMDYIERTLIKKSP